MTKCTYDELCSLTDDPDYHRALEQLFVLTSEEIVPHHAARRLPLAVLIATAGMAAIVIGVLWFISHQAASEKPADADGDVAVSAARR